MRIRRYVLTVIAFGAALILIVPIAYVLVAYAIVAGFMQAYPKWVLIGAISLVCFLVVLVPLSFAVREWRKNVSA